MDFKLRMACRNIVKDQCSDKTPNKVSISANISFDPITAVPFNQTTGPRPQTNNPVLSQHTPPQGVPVTYHAPHHVSPPAAYIQNYLFPSYPMNPLTPEELHLTQNQ